MGQLGHNDLEQIQLVIYKSADDVAVSIARSFERLEERVDATEARLYSRLGDIEDRLESRIVSDRAPLDE